MRTWITILSAFAAVIINVAAEVPTTAPVASTAATADAECDKLPADLSLEGCCVFPKLSSDEIVKKVYNEFKDKNFGEFVKECKVAEGIFKELKMIKDGAIDKDAMISHLEKEIKEASWKPVMKAAAEECYKDVMAQKDKIIIELEKAPFNITKTECNGLFMSMVTCIHLEGFAKCPKEAWTEDKKCNEAKIWIDKCGDDIDSLRQLVTKND